MSATVRRPEIVVDLGAIRRNVGLLRDLVAPDGSDVMVVVKADGYGHGMVEAAARRPAGRRALARRRHDRGGASGCARPATRAALLCWLTVPGRRLGGRDRPRRRRHGVHRGRARRDPRRGRPVRRPGVQLKIDTGLSRGGSTVDLWPDAAGRGPRRRGRRRLAGHRHLVALRLQRRARPPRQRRPGARLPRRARRRRAGRAATRRCATSPTPAGALLRPSQPLRPGPVRHRGVRSRPRARRQPRPRPRAGDDGHGAARPHQGDLHAGAAVSYGHTWTAPGETRVGLVPLGYGDGVPRHAGNTAEVWVDGKRRPIRGRICMDQFVVDLGDARRRAAEPGDEVVLFGPGDVGRADRRRLGTRLRHHPLRDRHPHGRPPAPPLRRRRRRMRAADKVLSVAGGPPVGRRRRRHRATGSPGAAPVIARRGAGDADGVRVAALGADHRGRRRRRRPARRGRRVRRHRPAARGQGPGADRGVHPRLLADPRLLALPARGLPRPGRARSTTTSAPTAAPGARRPGHATIEQLGRDLKHVLDTVVPHGPIVLVGHSMGGMTIMALAEEYPELFGDRIVGVGLISTTAGGLEPHRIVAPMLPVHRRRRGGGAAGGGAGARAPPGRRLPPARPLGGDGGHRRAGLRRRRARVVRRVRRRDAVVHAVRGGRGVLLQLRLARQVRDREGAVGGADQRSSAARRTRSPRSATAASSTPTSPARACSSARAPGTW